MPSSESPQSIRSFASRAPSRAPYGKRASAGYTLLLIPGESGTPWRFRLPKQFMVWAICACFCLFGALGAVLVDYAKLRYIVHDYERLRAENHSIRSEAAALISRLEGVQSALTRMDDFSTQIREMAKPEATCKGPRCKFLKSKEIEKRGSSPTIQQNTQGSLGNIEKFMNVGPVSKEDYLMSRVMRARALNNEPSVNFKNLEFRDAFERILKVGSRSEAQAKELERLLGDVKNYQRKLATTPTLAPVQGYVSSRFGDRESPFSGIETMHWGVDFAASIGTSVYAAAAGTVISARYLDDYGKVVDVDHGDSTRTRYAHLNSILVKPGDKISKGDKIGEVGNTGRSTGPHLHYEVEVAGRRVDPMKFIHQW